MTLAIADFEELNVSMKKVYERLEELQLQPLEMIYKKAVLKNFAMFTGKHLCWNLFLSKVASLKKRLQHSCFPVNISKNFKNTYFEEHL